MRRSDDGDEYMQSSNGTWWRKSDGLRCYVVTLEAARVIVWAQDAFDAKQRLRTSLRPRVLLPDVKVRPAHDDEVPGLAPCDGGAEAMVLFVPPPPAKQHATIPEDPLLARALGDDDDGPDDRWVRIDPAYL